MPARSHAHAHSLEMLHGHECIKLICLKNVIQRWLGVTANHKENTESRKYRKCWLQKATWKSLEHPNTVYGALTCTCVYTECINSICINVHVWLHTLVQPCSQLVSVAHYWKPGNRLLGCITCVCIWSDQLQTHLYQEKTKDTTLLEVSQSRKSIKNTVSISWENLSMVHAQRKSQEMNTIYHNHYTCMCNMYMRSNIHQYSVKVRVQQRSLNRGWSQQRALVFFLKQCTMEPLH